MSSPWPPVTLCRSNAEAARAVALAVKRAYPSLGKLGPFVRAVSKAIQDWNAIADAWQLAIPARDLDPASSSYTARLRALERANALEDAWMASNPPATWAAGKGFPEVTGVPSRRVIIRWHTTTSTT